MPTAGSLPDALASSRLMVRLGLIAFHTGPKRTESGTMPTHTRT